MTTAAAMVTPSDSGALAESEIAAIQPGMVVRHPLYGLGRVVDLSGAGKKRRAEIQFFSQSGTRKMMLTHADLQPADAEQEEP